MLALGATATSCTVFYYLCNAAVFPVFAVTLVSFGTISLIAHSMLTRKLALSRTTNRWIRLIRDFTRAWPSAASWIISVGVIVGMCIGLFQGILHPANLDFLLGRPVRVTGVVVSDHPVKGGTSSVVQMDQVTQLDARGNTRTISTRAKASLVLFGSPAKEISQGVQIRLEGVLGRPPVTDSKGFLLRQRMQKMGIRYELTGRLVSTKPSSSMWTSLVHARIDASVRVADPEHAANLPLIDSIVFGLPLADNGLQKEFLAAGLLHVLAASGANVLLVVDAMAIVVKPLFRRLRYGTVVWTMLVLCVVFAFCELCNNAPSIVRATIMVSYRQIGVALGRSPDTLCATLLAYTVMCASKANVVSTSSSVLSFVATIAVWLALRRRSPSSSSHAAGRSRRWLTSVLHHVLTSVRITVMVEVAMLPLSISYFGQITPYAVLSNVIAEPVLALLLPLSAAYMICSLICTVLPFAKPACSMLGICDAELLRFIQDFVETIATWKWAIISVPSWNPESVCAYYCVTIFTIWAWKHRKLTDLWYNPIELLVINFTKSVFRGNSEDGPSGSAIWNPDERVSSKGDGDGDGHGQDPGSGRRVRRCHDREAPGQDGETFHTRQHE